MTYSIAVGDNPKEPLLRIGIDGYRSFRDETTFELRPLTLLYGRNQAGKSTLLRMLPFLSDSLGDVPVLDLASPALRGATFKELGWLGPRPSQSWSLTVSVPGTHDVYRATFSGHDDGAAIANRVRIGRRNSAALDVSFTGNDRRSAKSLQATYAGLAEGQDWTGTLDFRGLLPEFPDGAPESAGNILTRIRAALEPVREAQWLSANRLAPTPSSTRQAHWCLPDGSDLAAILQGRDSIVRAASDWLQDADLVGEQLELRQDQSGRAQFTLRRSGREPLPLHLAGEGVRSLLPIVLCACWGQAKENDGPTMIVVEEPEAHLHPTSQIALLKRLLGTAKEIPVVLETHSIYILRAMQLGVLEGAIRPEDVSLYWVEQSADEPAMARLIEVQSDATLSGWHPDAFEEEQRLAHEILDRRWKRLKKT